MYFDEIADLLDATLLEEFCTQAEDDSVEEITEKLLSMHDEYRAGHAPTALAMLARANELALARQAALQHCREGKDPDHADESDAGEEEDEGGTNPVPMDDGTAAPGLPSWVPAQALPQLPGQQSPGPDAGAAQAPPDHHPPQVDGDGFQTVTRQRGRRR